MMQRTPTDAGGRTVLWRGHLLFALLASQLLASPLPAQARLTRAYAHEHGLIAPPVWALAQDSAGFLWVGTQAGLFRYDGNRFIRWQPARISSAIISVAVSARGRIAALDERGELFEVASGGARSLAPPAGGIERALHLLAFDADERLWTIRGGRVVRQDGSGWRTIEPALLHHERASQVRDAPDGSVLVVTEGGLWRMQQGGARKLATLPDIVDLLVLPDGRLLLLTFFSHLVEARDGAMRELMTPATLGIGPPFARGIALVRRHDTIWIALDRYLVALRERSGLEVLGAREGIESGGPLLTDREGSLWMGTFAALMQFPEPETRIWHDDHGLPSRHTRFVARSGSARWISTWQGAGYVWRDTLGWHAGVDDDVWGEPMCASRDGTLWAAGRRGILAIQGRSVRLAASAQLHIYGCGRAADGGVWLATSRGLWRAGAGTAPVPVRDVPPLAGDSSLQSVHEDAAGRLWIASEGEVCRAPVSAVLSPGGARWRCQQVGNTGKITGMMELPSGTLWMSTMRAGVLAFDGERWAPAPESRQLPTRAVFEMAPSREGGAWILGHGILRRVADLRAPGWAAVEQPRAWHGMPTVGGEDLLEDDDGTLWITTASGVVQLPRAARFAALPPPPVRLVEARVDEDPVTLTGDLSLPYERNRLELEFAALSFRDRSLLRYQIRLSPRGRWSEVRDQPSFHWVDLSPGRYDAEVRASLDGEHWSAAPARFHFSVLPPWYRSPAALAAFAAGAALLLWSVYRLRLTYLLGLERQRTRIAMDLHDEVGSGLGSIGILSSLLASNGMHGDDRRELAREIARASEELGSSLEDIIWSLDPRGSTLQELASRLVEHGGRLFADGDTEFRVELPGVWPERDLPLRVRRTVLLIGLEALHNAARHAGATVVRLRLARGTAGWELSVQDDGTGISPDAAQHARGGRGLEGMRRRAAEIGATLAVRTTPGTGTTVTLRFDVRSPGWVRSALRKARTVT